MFLIKKKAGMFSSQQFKRSMVEESGKIFLRERDTKIYRIYRYISVYFGNVKKGLSPLSCTLASQPQAHSPHARKKVPKSMCPSKKDPEDHFL